MTQRDPPSTLQRPDFSSPLPPGGKADVTARLAEFSELAPEAAAAGMGSLGHLLDVSVVVTAELGRVTLSIGEVLKLGIGSVVELARAVSAPVDLLVQGVPLARGEVVVVGDRFAIRITEILDPKGRLGV